MASASNTSGARPGPPAGPGPPDWRDTHIWGFQPVRDLMILGAVVGLFYLGYMARVVTVPLLVALLLAYLFEPLVRRLTRGKWVSRQGAAGLIIVCAVLLVVAPLTVGVGFAVVQGTSAAMGIAGVSSDLLVVMRFTDAATGGRPGGREVVDKGEGVRPRFEFSVAPGSGVPAGAAGVPAEGPAGGGGDGPAPPAPEAEAGAAGAAYGDLARLGSLWRSVADVMIQRRLAERTRRDGAGVAEASPMFRLMDAGLSWVQGHAQTIGHGLVGTGAQAVGVALSTAASIGMVLFEGFLTAFFFFFLSAGYGRVLAFWQGLIPERKKGRAFALLAQMDRVVSGFVRGRLLIALMLAGMYTIVYWMIGVPAPLVLGPVVGMTALMPYLAMVGMPLCWLLMLLEPSGAAWQQAWWWVLLAPVGAWALAQALDDYVLSPVIQGRHTGMDTPTILFASLAGGAVAGVYGLLLAIPIAACLKVVMREVFWPRVRAWAEGRAEDVLPIGKE